MTKLLLALPTLVLIAIVFVFAIGALARPRLAQTEVREAEISTEPGTYRVHLQHGGREREYLLHVPPGAGSRSPPSSGL